MALTWKPKLLAVDVRQLPLSPVEGYVVSRIDGNTTVAELSALTGQAPERLGALLRQLVNAGAIEPEPGTPPPFSAPPVEAEEPSSDEPIDERNDQTHLALYKQRLGELPEDDRIRLASLAVEPELSALCFDPLPKVIHAVLDNTHAGLSQARLIAAHHQNTTGLEFLLARPELARDAQVQRLLWRNPQLNEGQLRRLTANKRLLELWKLSISREATGRTRTGTAKALRTRFSTAASEEKVELIFSTEGRALAGLSGLPVDGKTAALLCARSYSSLTLVQNLAHWSAAPPSLIAHLLKQPLVARNATLRTLLSRHPNAPASAKT